MWDTHVSGYSGESQIIFYIDLFLHCAPVRSKGEATSLTESKGGVNENNKEKMLADAQGRTVPGQQLNNTISYF